MQFKKAISEGHSLNLERVSGIASIIFVTYGIPSTYFERARKIKANKSGSDGGAVRDTPDSVLRLLKDKVGNSGSSSQFPAILYKDEDFNVENLFLNPVLFKVRISYILQCGI